MIHKSLMIALLALLTLPLAAGCGPDKTKAKEKSTQKEQGASAAGGEAAAEAEATQIWTDRCTVCHGASGLGDGPGSASLDPKPRNFSDATWQDSVNDEHIEKIIVYGGIAVGKSAAMPSNPDLNDKPAVVKALRAHVRGLKKQ